MVDNRIAELVAWAAEESIQLPMLPEQIIALEDEGHTVDLRSGELIIDGASVRYELSVAGEALIHVWDLLEVLG